MMGMTEKRFMLDDAGEIIDLTNNKFIEYGNEVLDLLNAFYEENIRLKRDFDSCSHNWSIMYDEAKEKVEKLTEENWELEQENEQLKQQLKELEE